jgi:hypothetical protein
MQMILTEQKLKSLNERDIALFYYIGNFTKEDLLSTSIIQRRFPFSKYLFSQENIESGLHKLIQEGILLDVSDKTQSKSQTYRIIDNFNSNIVWQATYKRLITPTRSFLRDQVLTIVQNLKLSDIINLRGSTEDSSHPDLLLLEFTQDLRLGRLDWWKLICYYADLYTNVADNITPVSELLYSVADMIKIKIIGGQNRVSNAINKSWKNDEIIQLKAFVDDVTPWKSLPIQLFIVRGTEFSLEGRDQIKSMSLKALLNEALLAHIILPIGTPQNIAKETLKSTHHIIITPEDIKEIAIDQIPNEKFREILRSRMDIELLSPYQITGFVSGAMFHGREHEIRVVCSHQNTNFVIYGGRQSGKTSLMKALQGIWRKRKDSRVVFIDCERRYTEKALLNAICSALKVHHVNTFEDLLKVGKNFEKRTLLLIDEIDHILESCDVTRFLGMLRTLNEECEVQCILSGGTGLYALSRDIKEPMFNFADPLRLGPFTILEAIELAKEPMLSLGVKYEMGDSTVRQLVNICGLFPNLIQLMCQELIKKVRKEEVRVITKKMIDNVYNSAAFEDYVEKQFYDNFNKYQQLITCSSFLVKQLPLQAITQRVQKHYPLTLNAIKKHLDDLVLLFILNRDKDIYEWSYKQFPVILRRRFINLDFRIDQLISEIKGKTISA